MPSRLEPLPPALAGAAAAGAAAGVVAAVASCSRRRGHRLGGWHRLGGQPSGNLDQRPDGAGKHEVPGCWWQVVGGHALCTQAAPSHLHCRRPAVVQEAIARLAVAHEGSALQQCAAMRVGAWHTARAAGSMLPPTHPPTGLLAHPPARAWRPPAGASVPGSWRPARPGRRPAGVWVQRGRHPEGQQDGSSRVPSARSRISRGCRQPDCHSVHGCMRPAHPPPHLLRPRVVQVAQLPQLAVQVDHVGHQLGRALHLLGRGVERQVLQGGCGTGCRAWVVRRLRQGLAIAGGRAGAAQAFAKRVPTTQHPLCARTSVAAATCAQS